VACTHGLIGALASILHPWQGEMLIMLVVVAELIRWREHVDGRGLALPALTVTLTGLPCLYYLLLAHFDTSWALAQVAARHEFSFWSIAIGVAPLMVVAGLGYRGRPRTFLELMTRVWLPAAVLIYGLSAAGLGATPLHAFNGISAPLAVLAVMGVQRGGWVQMPRGRLVSFVAILVATIPANADMLAAARHFALPTAGNADFITLHERAALDFLQRDPNQGGVIAQFFWPRPYRRARAARRRSATACGRSRTAWHSRGALTRCSSARRRASRRAPSCAAAARAFCSPAVSHTRISSGCSDRRSSLCTGSAAPTSTT
jgi:hypothetical protein